MLLIKIKFRGCRQVLKIEMVTSKYTFFVVTIRLLNLDWIGVGKLDIYSLEYLKLTEQDW